MGEIKELDMNKYLVLEWKDLNKLQISDCHNLDNIINNIAQIRRDEGKQDNKYLVLNLDDGINKNYLMNWIRLRYEQFRFKKERMKVIDIAVDLVNAIQKAKEDT